LKASNIKVFPNPASGVLYLQMNNGVDASQARIYNSQSQLLKTFTLENQTQSLDILDLPAGFYFLNVQTNKGAVTLPFQALD